MERTTSPAKKNVRPFCMVKVNELVFALCKTYVELMFNSGKALYSAFQFVLVRGRIKPLPISVLRISMLYIQLCLHFSSMHIFCNARFYKPPVSLHICNLLFRQLLFRKNNQNSRLLIFLSCTSHPSLEHT